MPKKNLLFNYDFEDEEEDFKINEDYATNYDKWRRSEELAKLKAQGVSEEDSSSESSDEDGDGKNLAKPDNPEFDREFLLSLGTLYKIGKGEKVKVKDVQFFKGDFRVEAEKKEKPMTLKDLERQVIIEREGKYEDDEDDTANKEFPVDDRKKIHFDDGLDEDSDDDSDGLLNSGLFKVKEHPEKAMDKDDNAPGIEAVNFVKGVTSSVSDSKQKDILESVKNVWTNEKLSKKDKWLVDFFLNQRYLEEDTGEDPNYNGKFLDEEELSDEAESQEDNPLGTQYKYRHQEPGDLLKRHPRQISDSLRPKDEKRKEKREAAKQRMQAKKEEKRKEIEVLKALKYKEIEEKIDRIKEASGNEDIDLGAVDLDADFDPAEHEKYMEQMFGEDYYDPTNAEQELPEFEDEEDDTKIYDNWTKPSTSQKEDQEDGEEDYFAENYDSEDYMMDDYYNSQQAEESETKKDKKATRRKGRKHRSKFARAVEKEKPLFDPNEKDFASYFEDYYKLDFEDVVGGIPCRFKYRNVEANNFGLTTGEILAAQNSDLNKWVGLKKILKYNRTKEEEQKDRVYYENRSLYEHVKRKVMPSLFSESPEELANQEREKRRLKNLKRKQKRWMLKQGLTEIPENMEVAEEKQTNSNGKRPLEVDKKNYPHSTATTGNEEEVRVKKKKKNKRESNTEEDVCNNENLTSTEMNFKEDTDCMESTPAITGNSGSKKKKKKKKKQEEAPDDIKSTSSVNENHEMETKKPTEVSNGLELKKNKNLDSQSEESQSAPLHKKKKKKHCMKPEDLNDKSANNGTKKNKNMMKMAANSTVKNKDHKKKKHDKAAEYFQGISDARLEAYGQNPKKLKNRIKYGKDV